MAPESSGLPLTRGWVQQLLGDPQAIEVVYLVTRQPPYRLLEVRSRHDLPVSPMLMGRTVKTILGVLEPEQPNLADVLQRALAAVRPGQPVRFEYRSSRYGALRIATVTDAEPDQPWLAIYCEAY